MLNCKGIAFFGKKSYQKHLIKNPHFMKFSKTFISYGFPAKSTQFHFIMTPPPILWFFPGVPTSLVYQAPYNQAQKSIVSNKLVLVFLSNFEVHFFIFFSVPTFLILLPFLSPFLYLSIGRSNMQCLFFQSLYVCHFISFFIAILYLSLGRSNMQCVCFR